MSGTSNLALTGVEKVVSYECDKCLSATVWMVGHSVKHHVVYVMLNDDDNGFVFAGEQSGEYQSNSSIYRFDIMPMPSTLSLQPYGVAVLNSRIQ